MKKIIFVAAMVAAAGMLATSVEAAPQSKLLDVLNKVNNGLSAVTGVPVDGGQAASAGAAALANVKVRETGLVPQSGVSDQVNMREQQVEVHFGQGRNAANTRVFDEALPVINKVLGISSCASGADYEQSKRVAIVLKRYQMENSPEDIFYRTKPMQLYQYHDRNLCAAVKKLDVDVPAPNAVAVTATFIATDSLETSRVNYVFQKDYRGEWKVSKFGSAYN